MKLFLLRILIIITLFVAKIATGIFRVWNLYFPISSLLHYVVGSGKNVTVPYKVMEQARKVFLNAIYSNNYGNADIDGEYTVSHSTMYEGRGFYGRPILFYMVGCFNFILCNGKVKFSDEYDWHCNEQGMYFTSPLGSNMIIKLLATVAGKIWGYDLFIVPGKSDYANIICTNPDNVCISNKLWGAIGGKPFATIGEYNLQFTNDEEDRLREVFDADEVVDRKMDYVSRTVFDAFRRKHSALKNCSMHHFFNPYTATYKVVIYDYGTDNAIALYASVDDDNVVFVKKHCLISAEAVYAKEENFMDQYSYVTVFMGLREEQYDEEYDEEHEEEYEEYEEQYDDEYNDEYEEEYEEE